MYELVELKGNDVFTNSKMIAEGTGNQHKNVREIIQKYEEVFEKTPMIGKVTFKTEPSKNGQKEKIYFLNEGQAMFLMTLLRNDGVDGAVVNFKARLASEFIRMREFIREKQSKQWNDTRLANKENRLKETDVIKMLVDYAKEQGSTHSDKLYLTYTKLAKSIVGGNRDAASVTDLNNLTLVESIILQTIRIDMSMNMLYKDIYKDCKDRLERFADIAYLTA
jgi:phage regulator Rha-like protein|nr:MAG TPA: hypothetical protein [Caudoviricetes sp.]